MLSLLGLSYRFQVAFEEVLRCISDLADAIRGHATEQIGPLIHSIFQVLLLLNLLDLILMDLRIKIQDI